MNNPIMNKSLEFSVQVSLLNEAYVTTGMDTTVTHKLLEVATSMGANISKSIYGVDKTEFAELLHEALKDLAECIYLLNVMMQANLFAYDYLFLMNMAEDLKNMLVVSIKSARGTVVSKWDKYSGYSGITA